MSYVLVTVHQVIIVCVCMARFYSVIVRSQLSIVAIYRMKRPRYKEQYPVIKRNFDDFQDLYNLNLRILQRKIKFKTEIKYN